MVFKNYYMQLVIRVVLILTTSILLSWLVLIQQSVLFSLNMLLLLILQTWLLIRYVNKWNTELRAFFSRLTAGEFSIRSSAFDEFPRLKGIKPLFDKLSYRIKEEQKQHEIENEYFKVLSKNVSTGILVADHLSKVRFINPAALHFLGIEALHHIGHLERYHPGSFSMLLGMKTGEAGTLTIYDGSSRKMLMVRMSELVKDGEHFKVYSLDDIERVMRKNELDSWQKLIRVLNHEIMNSISPISSTVQTLSSLWDKEMIEGDGKKLAAKTLKGLKIIKERGEGLKTFVSAYRDLTTDLKPNLKKTEISDLIANVYDLFKSELEGKGIKTEIDCQGGTCEVVTDPNLLSQALINVLKNAMESFDLESINRFISINCDMKGQHLMIVVTDNGRGMDEAILKNASVPFFTTKEGGTGVGLSLTRQIITALGGDVHLLSKLGVGTKVELVLDLRG
jgi:nitrogen fixation/metabolism regulation signal transduction histidine kinase